MSHRADDHHGRSYKIRLLKMGCIITRTSRNTKCFPITVGEYLRNEVAKKNKLLWKSRLNELIKPVKLYENEAQDNTFDSKYHM